MKRIGLTTKFTVLLVGIVVVMLAVQVGWSRTSHLQQARAQMLDHAHGIALEMDAVWDFMERNQHQFVTDDQGRQQLYCVVAAKSVALTITRDSDYVIHYTNLQTRRPVDAPDSFEVAGLQAFLEHPNAKSYYELTENDAGEPVFRYMEPLRITESCLECHGSPKDEIDKVGYAKEGLAEGDLAGAMSLQIPAESYLAAVNDDTRTDVLLSAMLVMAAMGAVALAMRRLVVRPVGQLDRAAAQLELGDFDVTFPAADIAQDEVGELIEHFQAMAGELSDFYGNLESQVELRTEELTAANDLLERQTAELAAANEQLQADSAYRIRFLSVMSHELRTPLTSILAFIKIWKERHAARDAEEAKAMEAIEFNGVQLLGLVNNILEMARIDADRVRVDFEALELVDTMARLRTQMEPIAQSRGVAFSTQVDRDVPIIWADGEKVLRILENLSSNAVKFTPQGGHVAVRASFDAQDDCAVLTVVDDGVGIAPEDQEAIFDTFTQARGASAAISSGSGLGLSVVKELALLHGGSVSVQSALGEGSTFSVRIPRNEGKGEMLDG